MAQPPDVEQAILDTVRNFVDKDVIPNAHDLEQADAYPASLIDRMKQLGVYGLLIGEEHGGSDISVQCFARITEHLARGWMSLAGAMGSHSVISYMIRTFGTEEQREEWLPRLATGEVRAAMALTEPAGGSDLQGLTTVALEDGDELVINGTKTWITNARRAGLVALLCKTDPDAEPQHAGISVVLTTPNDGYHVSHDLPKLGYRGVESCEMIYDFVRVPKNRVLGGTAGEGFAQMMRGLEVGRIQVAARALGVGQAALDASLRYAQERETFGKPIWRHQSIGNYLADMATSLQAARLLTLDAARVLDEGKRADLEAGMAKLFASEVAQKVSLDAVRIHGGYGYSSEFDVERFYRDAPLMIVGEGTNEIQRNIIAKQLIGRSRL